MGLMVEVDIEHLLNKILATQQPFFNGLLNQLAALESRDIKRAEDLMWLRDQYHHARAQEYHERISELEREVEILKGHELGRNALVKATEWVPKMVGYLVILIGLVVFYLKFEVKK